MSWISSIFGGSNPTLNQNISQYGQLGSSQIGQGSKNENQAGNFWSGILSGNSADVMKTLAPQISALKTSAQQQNKTNAIFGNRSGGTAASAAATNDKVHSDITNLVGGLTGGAASGLASLGTTQTGTGLSALNAQTNASQMQMQNWQNSLFGGALTGGLGIGLGSAAKAAGLFS